MNEEFFNVAYAPQAGWPLLDETYGMGFDIVLNRSNIFADPPRAGIAYLLEYTFPEFSCDVELTWGAFINAELPNGICLSNRQSLVCQDGDPIPVLMPGTSLNTIPPRMDSIYIEDSQGLGNVAAFNLFGDMKICGVVDMPDVGTSKALTKRCKIDSQFHVQQGDRARVYLGVSLQMTAGATLELGRRGRDTSILSNEGKFEVVTMQGDPGFVAYTVNRSE